MCEYKIDTVSDDNLISIKMLHSDTTIEDLNICINKKVVLHRYNNSCIPHIGMCQVTLRDKDIKFQCSFFVVCRNGPALSGMPDCEKLQLLSVNCKAVEADHNWRKVNEQSKQDRSKTNKIKT